MSIDPSLIGWIAIGAVFVLLIAGIPVAFALAFVGFLGFWAINGLRPAMGIMGLVPYGSVSVYALSVIPLFILMGNLVLHAGFGRDIFQSAQNWLRSVRGGLAHATVVGCAIFGAVCGSGLASCAMMGRVAVPELLRHGYPRPLSIGVVAASGTLAQMIPPSVLMVIYALITNQSVGRMLIAGIVPGILTALGYSVVIALRTRGIRSGSTHEGPVQPQASEDHAAEGRSTGIWPIVLLMAIVVGGIYSGIFTPTEAAGVAASMTLFLALLLRRLNLRGIWTAMTDTMRVNAMLFLIMASAYIFGTLLATSRIPNELSQSILELEVPSYVVLAACMAMYLLLGTFFDMLAAMFLTLPVVFPIIVGLGYDPIWFGVLIVHLCQIALITPPYGLNLFVLKGVVPSATMGEVIRGSFPFVIADVFMLSIYMVFPSVITFLPHTMK